MSQRTRIGIEFSDTAIRIACATRNGNGWKIAEKVKAELLDGTIVQGEIKDVAQCTDALKQAMTKIRHRAPAVLCIPVQRVYVGMLHLPPGMASGEQVHAEASAMFPEAAEDLHILRSVLSSDAGGSEIGTAAVRQDVLRQYVDACVRAGIVISAITTVPAAIASSSIGKADTCALVVRTTAAPASITIVRRGYPIDETSLKAETEDEDIVQSLTRLLAEYAKKGMSVSRVLVAGSPDLAAFVEGAFGSAKKAKRKPGEEVQSTAITVSSLSQNKENIEWTGAASAATCGKPMMQLYEKEEGGMTWHLFAALVVLALGAVGYWMYRIGALYISFESFMQG